MDAAQGFSAQSAGAVAILVSTFLGFPISTTHAISGGVIGAGAAKRVSAVRWGVAGNILIAWLLTLPAAAAIAAATYAIFNAAYNFPVRNLRDAAIVMLLAFAVAFLPAGGNVAEAVLTAITMGFLAAIAWTVFVLSRQNQLTLAALSDGRRAILYGALGMIALLIAGSGELFSTRRRHARLDRPARRLGGGDLADLDRGEHLLTPERPARSALARKSLQIFLLAHHARVGSWDGRGVSRRPPAALAGRTGPPRSS